jgi:hypothetical protein
MHLHTDNVLPANLPIVLKFSLADIVRSYIRGCDTYASWQLIANHQPKCSSMPLLHPTQLIHTCT